MNGTHSRGGGGSYSRLTLEHNNTVSQVRGHDKVVFDDKRCLLSVENIPAWNGCLSPRSIYVTVLFVFPYLLMTLLAMIRCSESKKLNGGLSDATLQFIVGISLARMVHPVGRC